MKFIKNIILTLCLVGITFIKAQQGFNKYESFKIESGEFKFNGKAVKLHSGEIHYARIPQAYWRHRLQMVKAMGLNTIATYVFWNYHETSPGKWDFQTGNRNLSEFLKIAKEEGLMVILRPGPYVCAEWEFGGYPWFLQNEKDMKIREYNTPFLNSTKAYFTELYKVVKPYLIVNGGPIIMVQGENEFGSFVVQREDIKLEDHKKYSSSVFDQLKEVGFKDMEFFTSDGDWLFEGGALPGALPTANGDENPDNIKKEVKKYHNGEGPFMVAEYYPGWLDHWAEPFPRKAAEKVESQIKRYIDNDISFNIYMVHGGTNFGFTSGANYDKNHDIQPSMTSYDYDAPITEAGWETEKYMKLRELLKNPNTPPVPERIPVIKIPNIKLTQSIDLEVLKNNIKPIINDNPLTFEQLNQGHGYVWYSKNFNQPIKGTLKLNGLRDYAIVYVNGEKVGELNRYYKKYECEVDIPFNGKLDIIVENMGRINYGANINKNTKGIISPIFINDREITGDWEMYGLPFAETPLINKNQKSNSKENRPTIYKGNFDVSKVGDTFLDMRPFGKGIVFVNGINIGRYWSVGPQQTLYLPVCYLKKGQNEIVIFEQKNNKIHQELSTLVEPILDKLVPENGLN